MAHTNIDELKQLLAHSHSFLTILPPEPDLDILAAALGLHLSILKDKKQIHTYSPTQLTVEHNRLIGVDQVINQLTGNNLVISLPGQKDNIEKVYTEVNQQSGHFEIIIEPRKGYPSPDHQAISYAYQAFKSEVIFFIDTNHPNDFSHFEKQYFQSLISSTHLVRIGSTPQPDHPKNYEFVDQQASSVSEIIFNLLQGMQFEMDADIATNLLSGIEYKTANLTNPDTAPQTLETVAMCLRYGAIRAYSRTPLASKQPASSQTLIVPEKTSPAAPVDQVTGMDQEPEQVAETQPQDSVPEAAGEPEGQEEAKGSRVPDWLIPKIVSKVN